MLLPKPLMTEQSGLVVGLQAAVGHDLVAEQIAPVRKNGRYARVDVLCRVDQRGVADQHPRHVRDEVLFAAGPLGVEVKPVYMINPHSI